MIIDARDISFDEMFKELKDVVSLGFAALIYRILPSRLNPFPKFNIP